MTRPSELDELEARLAALEGLVLERLALEPGHVLRQLIDTVRTWPEGDERAQALQTLDDALRRFDGFNTGMRILPD